MNGIVTCMPGSTDYNQANDFAEAQYRSFGILSKNGNFRELPDIYLMSTDYGQTLGVMGIFIENLPLMRMFNIRNQEASIEIGRVAFAKMPPRKTLNVFQEMIRTALSIRENLDCGILIETHGSMCKLARRAISAVNKKLSLEKIEADIDLGSIPESGRSFFEKWQPAVFELFGLSCAL